MKRFINIMNVKQASFYAQNGVLPVGVFFANRYGRFAFVFRAEDTTEVWNRWREMTNLPKKIHCADNGRKGSKDGKDEIQI